MSDPFEQVHRFDCPFCKATCFTGKKTATGEIAALHAEPKCAEFKKHNAVEFLALAKQKLEGVKPA